MQRGYDHDWKLTSQAVLEAAGHTCTYCGGHATTVDHVVPLSKGGARLDPTNLVAACRPCNSAKRDRTA